MPVEPIILYHRTCSAYISYDANIPVMLAVQLIRSPFFKSKIEIEKLHSYQTLTELRTKLRSTPDSAFLVSAALSLVLGIFYSKILKMKCSRGLGIGPEK